VQALAWAANASRLLQIGVADALLAQAIINRIRHYYAEMAPEAEAYLSFPYSDDQKAVVRSMMPFHSPLQGFASTPGPVILINSVLTGAFASILAGGLLPLTLLPAILIGLGVMIVALTLHIRYAERVWQRGTQERMEFRFPAPISDA
jgi:hypothetical protein